MTIAKSQQGERGGPYLRMPLKQPKQPAGFCEVIPAGNERPCAKSGCSRYPDDAPPVLCPEHRKEYGRLTAKYKATSKKVEILYNDVKSHDLGDTAPQNKASIDAALDTAQKCIDTIDREILERREHHSRFFVEPDAGHARWLKDLRSKLQEVQVISEQMRCRKAKLAEGAQVEALLLQSQADCSVVDHRRPSITVTARLPLAPVNNTLLETTSSGTQPEGAQQLEHASCLPLAPVKIVQQKAEAGPFSVPGEDVQLLASCPPLTPADTTPSEATQTRFSRVDPTGSPPLTLVNAAQPESAWQQPTNLPSAPAIDVPLEETQPRHRVVESDGAHLTARPPSAPESIAQPEGTPTLCSSVQPEPAERPPVVLAKSPQLVKALERYSSVNAQSGNAWIYPAPRRLPILPIPASTVQLEETQAHRSGVQPEHPAPPPLPPRRARPGPEANTASLPCSDPLQASETPGVRHSVISGRRCGAIVPGARQHDIYSFCTAARADSGSLCVAHAEEYCSVVERRKVAIEEYYALMADVSLVRRNASSIRTHCANRSASRDIAQDIEQVRRYVAALERVAQCEKRISLLGKHVPFRADPTLNVSDAYTLMGKLCAVRDGHAFPRSVPPRESGEEANRRGAGTKIGAALARVAALFGIKRRRSQS